MPSASNEPSIPGRLRVADVDMDGFPDFVMTLRFKSQTADLTKSTILLNQAGEAGSRVFAQVKRNDGSYLSKVLEYAGDTAAFLCFIDIDDDGKMDFIV